MGRRVVLAGLAFLAVGCGASNEKQESGATKSAEPARDAAAAAFAEGDAPASTDPEAAAPAARAQPTLFIAPPEATPPMPAKDTEVCDDVLQIANGVRATGARFYAIAKAQGAIRPPDWTPADIAGSGDLIAEGLYDGWCEAPERVNPATRAAFTEAERADCRSERTSKTRAAIAGDGRLESAPIDIDRDGDVETVYQYLPGAASAGTDPNWMDWNLAPRIFVSPQADAGTHRQLHKTVFAPVASLFFRNGELYSLQPMSGAADRYQIFWVMASAGRLGQIPLCELKAEGQ
ncbi:MAG: hypothetical protein HXY21_10890 [Parvularculaceae bacterium]|nr:hypothetical protein [Parvularculaceae bacterium]